MSWYALAACLITAVTGAPLRAEPPMRGVPASDAGAVPRSFSDEELFRGLMLGSGPVADLIPEIRDHAKPELFVHSGVQLARLHQTHERLLTSLRQRDPAFFEAFGREVRSGNRVRIERAYRTAGKTTLEALRTLPEAAPLNRAVASESTGRTGGGRGEGAAEPLAHRSADRACVEVLVVVSIVATVAGVVNYVVAAQIALVKEAVWLGEEMAVANGGTVLHEQMIDSVARLLRAA